MDVLTYEEFKKRCLMGASTTYVRWGGKAVPLSELSESEQDFQIGLWWDKRATQPAPRETGYYVVSHCSGSGECVRHWNGSAWTIVAYQGDSFAESQWIPIGGRLMTFEQWQAESERSKRS